MEKQKLNSVPSPPEHTVHP